MWSVALGKRVCCSRTATAWRDHKLKNRPFREPVAKPREVANATLSVPKHRLSCNGGVTAGRCHQSVMQERRDGPLCLARRRWVHAPTRPVNTALAKQALIRCANLSDLGGVPCASRTKNSSAAEVFLFARFSRKFRGGSQNARAGEGLVLKGERDDGALVHRYFIRDPFLFFLFLSAIEPGASCWLSSVQHLDAEPYTGPWRA